MKIPTLHQQMFGDINKQLSNIRAQLNEEIQEKCFEILEKNNRDNAKV